MKKFITTALVVLTPLISSSVFAAGDSNCHFHGNKPASESIIVTCANQQKNLYVKTKKITQDWNNIIANKASIIDSKNKEWRVTFTNPNIVDKSKQNLFMFFTLQGNFIAANYVGK